MSDFKFRKLPLPDAILLIERRLGLDDAGFAAEVGVSRRAVEDWRYRDRMPSYRNIMPLKAIARKANVEIDPESMIRE